MLILVIIILALISGIVTLRSNSLSEAVKEKTSTLESAKQQFGDESNKNSELKSKLDTQRIAYKNAQGRLASFGDGSGKVCYLTFDDGPCQEVTLKNLEILKQKGVVATWFCLGNTDRYDYLDLSICKQIEEQGSVVGIHDWDQDGGYAYYKGDVQNYFDSDFNKVKDALEQAVGHEIKICRFAGGSATIGYYATQDIGKALPQELIKRGYQFFDWNASAMDSDSSKMNNDRVVPKEVILNSVMTDAKYYAEKNSPICVLMHDNPGKTTTTEALPEMIDQLKALGYEFKTLSDKSPGFYQRDIN